ncbi:hypothetical protein LCGC14_1518000 [marine sediment metagenome]|uniref:Uncharacterized protein n=1 Tax=marine sediment metagenome TaxID=412755 RepID=A0A0F9M0P0_9ZZZZ
MSKEPTSKDDLSKIIKEYQETVKKSVALKEPLLFTTICSYL